MGGKNLCGYCEQKKKQRGEKIAKVNIFCRNQIDTKVKEKKRKKDREGGREALT